MRATVRNIVTSNTVIILNPGAIHVIGKQFQVADVPMVYEARTVQALGSLRRASVRTRIAWDGGLQHNYEDKNVKNHYRSCVALRLDTFGSSVHHFCTSSGE